MKVAISIFWYRKLCLLSTRKLKRWQQQQKRCRIRRPHEIMAANFHSTQIGEKEMPTAAVSRSVKLRTGLLAHLDTALCWSCYAFPKFKSFICKGISTKKNFFLVAFVGATRNFAYEIFLSIMWMIKLHDIEF